MKYTILLFLLFMSPYGHLGLKAQEIIGTYSYDSIRQHLIEYEDFKKETQLLEKKIKREFFLCEEKCNYGIRVYFSQPHLDSADIAAIQKLENELAQEVEELREWTIKEKEQLKKRYDKLIKEKIHSHLQHFVEEMNLSHLLEVERVLYCDPCIDYTEELINFIKYDP